MIPVPSLHGWSRRKRAVTAGAVAAGVAAAVTVGGWLTTDDQARGIPIPWPIYSIESVSGSHTASLLNLPLGQPGVPQVPVPVDIDGDLLPDVTVGLNLISVNGALQNPPVLSDIIAPNIEMNRLITAPVLGQPAKPLRINIKLTLLDSEGAPPMDIRFGYDTGLGGSIPNTYRATLGGLQNFFNPLSATVTTNGGYIGIIPGLPDLGIGPVSSSYDGPLTIIGGVETEGLDADVQLEYSPFPDAINISYGTDDAGGQHITYAHGTYDNVDVLTDLSLQTGDTHTEVLARVDRMPRRMAVDFITSDDGSGRVDYRARSDGRPPDVGVDLSVHTPGEAPLNAEVDITGLPNEMSAAWELPQDGPMHVDFASSDQGVGAIEARIATFDGDPTTFTPFVPSRSQYVNAQGVVGSDNPFEELLITARLERLRHVELTQADDGGFVADLDVGDGELPLEANLELDLRGSDLPKLDALATIAPLPDQIHIELDPAGEDPTAEPMRVVYDSSESVDIDLDAEIVNPEADENAGCGDPETICATLDARNVPSHLDATIVQPAEDAEGGETFIDLNVTPRAGSTEPDLRLHAILGALDPDSPFLAAPIEAKAEIKGVPPAIRVRMLQNADDNLEELEVHACDRDFASGTCSPETDGDEVGEITFLARNFAEDDRPADMAPASPLTPLYVTASARGLDDTTDLVHWEATARFTDIARIQFTNVDDVIGISTDVGESKDFSALVDVRNVDLPEATGGVDGGRTDIVGEVLLNPLPGTIDLCIGNAGRELDVEPINAVTAPCQSEDPFGDGSVETSPMAIVLHASDEMNVDADLRIDEAFDPDDPTDDRSTAFQGELTNVPADLTALLQSPGPNAVGPMRLLTVAPDAINFDATVAAQFTTGGADCDDPDAAGGDIACIHAVVDDIPTHISAYADTSVPGSANIQFYACDYDFANAACATPMGQIGAVTASARIKTGTPDPLPVRQSSAVQHIVMVGDQEIDDDDPTPDKDLQASIAVRLVRALSLIQTPDGFDGHTDLGNNLLPLEAVAYLDLRNDDLTEGVLVDADARITPLPAQMTFSQHGPGADQAADPLVFTYDSSAAVDIVANGKVFPANGGDECAEVATACAHVEIDDIPEHVVAVISKVDGELDGSTRPTDLSIDLALVPDNPLAPKVDVRANGVVGPSLETPTAPPLYLDAALVGAPRYTSVRLEGQETLVPGVDGLEVDSTAIERLRFHACQLDANDVACVPSTEGEVDDLTVTARSFALRPTDFPPPPAFAEPLFASVVQRDGLMEATAHLTDISEAQYINRDGLTGVRTVVGGNQNLGVSVDIEGLPLGEPDEVFNLGDYAFDDAELDLKARASVTPLPGVFDFCFREGGLTPLPLPTGLTFTQPCETARPFGDDVDVDHSPLSIAYRAETGGSPFGLSVTADAAINGIDHETGEPADPHAFHGKVSATQLPESLDIHVLSPIEQEIATPDGIDVQARGPMRILIDAPGVVGAGPTLGLEASYLIGEDAVCKDARATVSALCFKGDLVNLPTRTEVFYDPDIDPFDPNSPETDNLIVTTSGTGDTNLEGLELSSVKPGRDEDGALTGKADVLLVEGEILGIPKPLEIRGQIDLPDDPDAPPAIEFLVQDDKYIDTINVRVQNYIAPDPLAGLLIPDRSVGAGGGDPDQEIHFLQRGEYFLLDAHIEDFQGAGFKETRSTSAPGVFEGMGTYVANLDFGANQDVRAFIDLQSDAVSRIIADVLIEDMAAGIDLCFRSAYTDEQKLLTPDDPSVFCDSGEAADDEGAFQFASTPQGLGQMDIDAFIRMLSGGGSTILAARADIENVPATVQGTLPNGDQGDLEIEALDSGGNPDGIDQIVFQAASFDLLFPDTGYDTQLPYQPRPQPGGLFPADPPPPSGNQYVHAVIAGSDFHARGQIGKLVGPSSQLQRLFLSPQPCPAPANNPPDYPHYPDDNGVSDYTCIRADFDSDDEDPLDLSLRVGTAEGEEIHLRDAGITDVPSYLQATLASTETYLRPDDELGFRRPCRAAAVEPDSAIDCMPPLLRVDQPEADSELFGILEYGQPSDLQQLDGVSPALQLADLDARPGDQWGDWGADPEGIRAKVLVLGSDGDDSRVAIRAGIRLDIPRSLTLDQIQIFSNDALVPGTIPNSDPPETGSVGGQKALDLRLRYAVRDSSGNPVNNIGELTALIHDEDAGDQILVARPCGASTNDNVSSAGANDRPLTCNGGYDRGMPIPGELGLQLYLRQRVYQVEVDEDTNLRDETYIQVDGRASAPVDVGVRMVPEGGPGTADDGVGLLEFQLRGTPTGTVGSGTNPLEPSFRLRAELLKDKNIEPPAAVTYFPVVTHTDVKVNSVFADFNFTPDDTNPARRVDAMIHLRSETAVGADIAGYSTVNGNSPAEISAVGGVDIDPLDVTIESRLSFNFSVRDILHEALEGAGFFGDIIAEIFGGLADAVLDGLEKLVNAFPLIITLESGLLAEFQIDHLSRFTMRNDLLHAKVFTNGSGFGRLGPINLDMDTFSAGVNFRIHIPFPWPLSLIFDDIDIVVPLLTIDYFEFLAPPIPELFDNTLINFRDCNSLDIVNPFPFGEINQAEIDGGDSKNFLLYPMSDPRYQLSGVLSGFLGGPLGDLFLDLVAGPIFCAAFDPDGVFIEGLGGSHPGTTTSYPADQPVPGLSVLPEVVEPTNDPVPPPPPPPPPPGPPAPPPVPTPPGPAFSGPTVVIDPGDEVPLCGTHTFGALTINGNLTVATSPNAANPYGTGPACPAGEVGRLTLRANNLIVTGSVRADGIISTNPSPGVQPNPASGTSGAGHGGDGGDGTLPSGGDAYGNTTDAPATFPGSPGAGAAPGNGGGVIRLVGDDQVIVTGTVSANGASGGSNTSGICDADPDDDGTAGHGTFIYDPDPDVVGDEFAVPNAVLDGAGWGARPNAIADYPPGLVDAGGGFEHAGTNPASGGGSGGGIVITATRVTLTGATVEARGGNGGNSRIAAGGAGAGGLIKVVAPIQTGVAAATDVGAGLADASALCNDPVPLNPLSNLDSISANIPTPTAADAGAVVRVQPPSSQVLPFGQFWYPAGPGAPSASFDAYLLGASQGGVANGVRVVTCAVTLPLAVEPNPTPANLAPLFTAQMPTNQPTVSQPCGSGGPGTIVQLDSTRIFDDEFEPPDPDAKVSLTPPATSQYLGIYSIAIRPTTPNNDCLVPGDAGGVNDALDCVVEPLPGTVDAVVGIDAARPTIGITSPAAGVLPLGKDTVDLVLNAADGLSGIRYLECRTSPQTDFAPCNASTPSFQLLLDGDNTIEARAHDVAGNVSTVASVVVRVDRTVPTATATISPPDGNNGWHRTPPSITISGHDEPAHAAVTPYAYRFDNGAELTCAVLVCNVPASEINELLPGGHTFHFTAIDDAGNRLHDDNDPSTPTPMQRPFPGQEFDFRIDPTPPLLDLAFTPPADRLIGPNEWYDTRPFVVAGAIDQVGASGVNRVTHDFPGDGLGAIEVDDVSIDLGDGNGFQLFNPFDPPRLGDGVHNVCARAVDAAGNQANTCEVVRVDSSAPDSVLSVVPPPDGANGWYVTVPTLNAGSYDDHGGVGAITNQLRYRVDNDPYSFCNDPCVIGNGGLDTGHHKVHLAGRDRFDNVHGEQTVDLKVDLDDPRTVVLITPDPAAGSNDWQLKRPYVRLFAFDQDGGSGVDRIEYEIDGGGVQTYTGPFRIERGEHELCVSAVDKAGRAEPEQCQTVRVDLDEPTTTISAVPAAPNGGSGWYVSVLTATTAGVDAPGDSGVNQAFDPDLSDLCSHLPHAENPTAPSGTCVSLDGRPFVPYDGAPMSVREGVHTVRSYAVDEAGRRGPITTQEFRVDLSAPVVTHRYVPPAPALGPWYRAVPDVRIEAIDGDQNSGVALVEYRVNANPFAPYTRPFSIGEGNNTLDDRATDNAGLVGNGAAPEAVRVDLTPPVIRATQPSPGVLVQSVLLNTLLPNLLGPQFAQLGWTVTENLSTTVRITVIIHDILGNVVRKLNGGTVNVVPGVPYNGSTKWDGKDHTVLQFVPLGLYYYRVVAYDEAGNVAHSGESKPVQLRAAVCLPLVGCL